MQVLIPHKSMDFYIQVVSWLLFDLGAIWELQILFLKILFIYF